MFLLFERRGNLRRALLKLDRIHTRVRVFRRDAETAKIAFRYEMRREEDNELICLSEAIKVLSEPPGRVAAHGD